MGEADVLRSYVKLAAERGTLRHKLLFEERYERTSPGRSQGARPHTRVTDAIRKPALAVEPTDSRPRPAHSRSNNRKGLHIPEPEHSSIEALSPPQQ